MTEGNAGEMGEMETDGLLRRSLTKANSFCLNSCLLTWPMLDDHFSSSSSEKDDNSFSDVSIFPSPYILTEAVSYNHIIFQIQGVSYAEKIILPVRKANATSLPS